LHIAGAAFVDEVLFYFVRGSNFHFNIVKSEFTVR